MDDTISASGQPQGCDGSEWQLRTLNPLLFAQPHVANKTVAAGLVPTLIRVSARIQRFQWLLCSSLLMIEPHPESTVT
jgi:hypothetical protein